MGMVSVITNSDNAKKLDGYTVDKLGSRPNLLINPDFRINQRNLTEYKITDSSTKMYTVDMWHINSITTLKVSDSKISIQRSGSGNAGIGQYIDIPFAALAGSYVTLSIGNTSGDVYHCTGRVNSSLYSKTTTITSMHVPVSNALGYHALFGYSTVVNRYYVSIWMNESTDDSVIDTISWIKVEIGETPTPFTPPTTTLEFSKCKRFYQAIRQMRIPLYDYEASVYAAQYMLHTSGMRIPPTVSINKSIIYIDPLTASDSNIGSIEPLWAGTDGTFPDTIVKLRVVFTKDMSSYISNNDRRGPLSSNVTIKDSPAIELSAEF